MIVFKTEQAHQHKESIVNLLKQNKLPFADLPAGLEHFIIIKQAEKLIGAAGLEIYNQYGLLRSLVVDEKSRGNGAAAHLLSAIENIAHQKCIKTIYLFTETAENYFRLKGFKTISRNNVPIELQQSSEFSYACPQSAIVMYKNILK